MKFKKIIFSLLSLTLLGSFLFPLLALAANPVINSDTGSSIRDATESSNSFTYTVTGGSNEMLLAVGSDNGTGLSAATFNGTSMTVVSDCTGTNCVEYAYLVAPATGAHTLALTYNGNYGHAMTVVRTITNVLQSGSIGLSDLFKQGTSVTSLTHTASSLADNSLLIQDAFVNGDGTGITDGGSQTLIQQLDNTNTQHLHTAYQNTTTHGSYTFSETWSGGAPTADYMIEIKYQAPSASNNFFQLFE